MPVDTARSRSACETSNIFKGKITDLWLLKSLLMGVTIEQYRARIGAHNNIVRIKKYSIQLEGNFRHIIMLMLFQLVILTIIILMKFIRICYLSIVCLPTKGLAEQIKRFSQVILSFTEMSHYIVYVPLLLRMANDVEENPGPTVYDVVDPTKTIFADFSQGNTKQFRQNAGKQCLAMSLTAIIYSHIINVSTWDSSLLNDILCAGNNLYSFISNSVNKTYLLLPDVPEMVSVFDNIYYLQYGDALAGDLLMATTTLPYYSLENAFNNLFGETQLNYQHYLLTIDCYSVAIFKTSEGNFKIFDSHSRDLYGMPHPFGKCILASVEGIENLVTYFQSTVPQGNVIPFEVKGVTVQLTNSEITQIVGLTSTQNAKEHVKQKCSEETESQKQSRLENGRKYQKMKRAVETETRKQTRLESVGRYTKTKRAVETETEKQSRLENAREYKKAKQAAEKLRLSNKVDF